MDNINSLLVRPHKQDRIIDRQLLHYLTSSLGIFECGQSNRFNRQYQHDYFILIPSYETYVQGQQQDIGTLIPRCLTLYIWTCHNFNKKVKTQKQHHGQIRKWVFMSSSCIRTSPSRRSSLFAELLHSKHWPNSVYEIRFDLYMLKYCSKRR